MKSNALNGKVAIITGASKGIGAAIAESFAESGAHVVLSSRKQEAVKEVSDALNTKGLSTSATACHVGKEEDLKNLVDFTIDKYGRIDLLVNNAATNPFFGPLEQYSSELFDKIMNVNIKSCMLLSNLCLPYLKENETGGGIINIASVEGLRPTPGLSVYSISKSALIMLTKSQAREWGKYNVISNAICPGLIKTKFSKAIWENEKFLEGFVGQLPLQRMGMPDEIAQIALMLATGGSYCTGSVINADGGYLI